MKQIDKQGAKNQIGAWGEEIAARYLTQCGYRIIERNYQKKWGEIDLIVREISHSKPKLRFVEVKTVSYEVIIPYEQVLLQQNKEKRYY